MSKRGNPNWHKGGTSPNPNGRPRADASADAKLQGPVGDPLAVIKRDHAHWLELAYKSDGWHNILTGHGTSTYDKRYGGRFCSDIVVEEEGRELWRGDDLAARAVEAIVDEAMRKPFKICIPDEAEGNDEQYGKELVDTVEDRWEQLEAMEVLHEAQCIERACGGSAILLGADDGALSLEEPLDMERVKTFEWLTVLEPREVHPVTWYTDARAPKFGKPEIYQLTPIITGAPKPGAQLTQMVRVHESRLIVFRGIRVSRTNQLGQVNSFGDNIFTRAWRVLRDFNAAYSGAGILVHDFATPIFKIKGLADIIAKDNKELFQARMQALSLAMSTCRAALIDAEEEYRRDTTTVTGLPDLLLQFCKRLAAAFNTPVSILFGESPGGLNASGAQGDQLQIWNNRCDTQRTKKVIPALRIITRLVLLTNGGEPDKWWIEAEPLYSPSDKEKADTEKVETDTIAALWDRGLVTTDEVRRNPEFAKRYGITHATAATETIGATDPAAAALRTPGGDPNATAPTQTDPNATVNAAGASEVQKQAMNGAQVTSLIEVIKEVAAGNIPAQSAQKILELAFQLSSVDAAAMLPSPGFKSPGFKSADAVNAEKAAAQPAPSFGGGGGFPPKGPPDNTKSNPADQPKPLPDKQAGA